MKALVSLAVSLVICGLVMYGIIVLINRLCEGICGA